MSPRALDPVWDTPGLGRDWERGEKGVHLPTGQVEKLRPRIGRGTFKVTQGIGDTLRAGTLGLNSFPSYSPQALLGVETRNWRAWRGQGLAQGHTAGGRAVRPELWSDAVWLHPSPQDGQKVGTRSGPGQAGLLRAERSAPGSSRLRLERGARAGLAEFLPSQPCRQGGCGKRLRTLAPSSRPGSHL